MIVGIGCDIVEHDCTRVLNWETDISIQKRIFSGEELKIFEEVKNLSFLAGRFAAKEAVLKSLGTGMQDGILLTDIHIVKGEMNMPVIKLKGMVLKLSNNKGIKKWHLTISHSSNFSMAMAIAEF